MKLERLEIAAPCPARWADMKGDERVRFCAACRLNVYDLSGMKRREAEALVRAIEGRTVCLRLLRRADGTVITSDCPVGLALRASRQVRRAALWIATILGLGVLGGFVERSVAAFQGAFARQNLGTTKIEIGVAKAIK